MDIEKTSFASGKMPHEFKSVLIIVQQAQMGVSPSFPKGRGMEVTVLGESVLKSEQVIQGLF
jgi:hypothetical protein